MKTVENKVVAGVVANVVVMVVTWVATRYLGGLSPELSAEVSGAAAVVGSAAAGWITKHSPRTEEVLESALEVLAANGQMPGTMGSAAGAAIPDGPTDVRPEGPAPADTEGDVDEFGNVIPEPSADVPPEDTPDEDQ